MALIRNILFVTFDERDDAEVKKALQEQFEAQGYIKLSELKAENGIIKEIIMQGAVQMGDFKQPDKKLHGVGSVTAKQKQEAKGLIKFDTTRER